MIPSTLPVSAICVQPASAASHADTVRQAQAFANLMAADPAQGGMSNLLVQPLALNQLQTVRHLKLDDEE